jgi:hypothetical protein
LNFCRLYSTTITKPVTSKKPASFLLSDVVTRGSSSPYRLDDEKSDDDNGIEAVEKTNNFAASASLSSFNLLKKQAEDYSAAAAATTTNSSSSSFLRYFKNCEYFNRFYSVTLVDLNFQERDDIDYVVQFSIPHQETH